MAHGDIVALCDMAHGDIVALGGIMAHGDFRAQCSAESVSSPWGSSWVAVTMQRVR